VLHQVVVLLHGVRLLRAPRKGGGKTEGIDCNGCVVALRLFSCRLYCAEMTITIRSRNLLPCC
jgi:hypothetical protein